VKHCFGLLMVFNQWGLHSDWLYGRWTNAVGRVTG
jgi:hypothetical protein